MHLKSFTSLAALLTFFGLYFSPLVAISISKATDKAVSKQTSQHTTKHTSKASSKPTHSVLKSIVQKYKKSEMTSMKVEKLVRSELMGTETKYLGKIAISSGLFRWENTEPEKSLLVFDGQTIWSEQSPPKEFPGPAQVAKARLDKRNKSQIMIGSLLSGGTLFENFNILDEKIDADEYRYKIAPKTAELKIKMLDIKASKKNKEVVEISYQDDVGNLTTMKFSKIEFNQKKNKELFKYAPPAGAQVTNL